MKFKVSYEIFVLLIEFGIFALSVGLVRSIVDKLLPERKKLNLLISVIVGLVVAFVAYQFDVASYLA